MLCPTALRSKDNTYFIFKEGFCAYFFTMVVYFRNLRVFVKSRLRAISFANSCIPLVGSVLQSRENFAFCSSFAFSIVQCSVRSRVLNEFSFYHKIVLLCSHCGRSISHYVRQYFCLSILNVFYRNIFLVWNISFLIRF